MKPGVLRSACTIVTLGLDRAEAIEPRAVLDAGDDIVVGPRRDFPAFMLEAGDLAVASRAHADAVPRLGAIGRDGEALVAGRDQLDRAVERLAASATSPVRGVICALEPKAPPTKWLMTRTLSGSMPSFLRRAVLEAVHELAGLVDRQFVVVPDRGRGEQLDRVVMLGRRGVGGVELDLGVVEAPSRRRRLSASLAS